MEEKSTEGSRLVGILLSILLVAIATMIAAANDHSMTGDTTLAVFMLSLIIFIPLCVWLFFIRNYGKRS